MAEPAGLPVVVTCNLEPDARVTSIDGTGTWDGVDRVVEAIEQWRAADPDTRLTWLWRCDPAIAKGFGDAGWALRRWRSQIRDLYAGGDDLGVHPHIWRWSEPLKTFVADQANGVWTAECVRVSVETFARDHHRPPHRADGRRLHGSRDPRALVDGGVTLDLTLEPGGAPKERMVHTELTTGTMPDRRRTPRRPFRPSWTDACRPGRRRHAPLWALPITTSTEPLVVDGVVVDPAGTAANLGLDPHRFRHIVTTGLEASAAAGAPYVNTLVRSDVGVDARLMEFTLQNLEWLRSGMRGLADRWGGTAFVTGPAALARLGIAA